MMHNNTTIHMIRLYLHECLVPKEGKQSRDALQEVSRHLQREQPPNHQGLNQFVMMMLSFENCEVAMHLEYVQSQYLHPPQKRTENKKMTSYGKRICGGVKSIQLSWLKVDESSISVSHIGHQQQCSRCDDDLFLPAQLGRQTRPDIAEIQEYGMISKTRRNKGETLHGWGTWMSPTKPA